MSRRMAVPPTVTRRKVGTDQGAGSISGWACRCRCRTRPSPAATAPAVSAAATAQGGSAPPSTSIAKVAHRMPDPASTNPTPSNARRPAGAIGGTIRRASSMASRPSGMLIRKM